MKARNMLQILGFRSKPRHFHYEESVQQLDEGVLKYYRWRHPSESVKSISQDTINQYREVIQEGDFCIDIGAHTGDTTLPIGVAAGVNGFVLALEPNPYVYHVLEKNIRANRKIANIESILAAAAISETFLEFEYSDSGFCNGGRHEGISVLQHGHAYKQEVFGISLEKELESDFSEWLPKLKFVKVDAEGYDLYILRSIANLIEKCRPAIKAEVFTKTSAEYRLALFEFFEKHHYTLFKVEGGPVQKGAIITRENLHSWRSYDVIGFPD